MTYRDKRTLQIHYLNPASGDTNRPLLVEAENHIRSLLSTFYENSATTSSLPFLPHFTRKAFYIVPRMQISDSYSLFTTLDRGLLLTDQASSTIPRYAPDLRRPDMPATAVSASPSGRRARRRPITYSVRASPRLSIVPASRDRSLKPWKHSLRLREGRRDFSEIDRQARSVPFDVRTAWRRRLMQQASIECLSASASDS